MTAALYAKLVEAIETYGFIDPLTVRRRTGITGFQVIDGEHRMNVGLQHSDQCDPSTDQHIGYSELPCFVIDGLSDPDAKKLTIVMNELHGQADPDKMGDLLNEILQDTSLDSLLKALPYDGTVLAGFLGTPLPELPPLPDAPPPAAAAEPKEVWAERLYKMPKSVALVVDEAIEKAKDGEEIEAWQGLERVAAGFLAS